MMLTCLAASRSVGAPDENGDSRRRPACRFFPPTPNPSRVPGGMLRTTTAPRRIIDAATALVPGRGAELRL
jgi:hypothetical protein